MILKDLPEDMDRKQQKLYVDASTSSGLPPTSPRWQVFRKQGAMNCVGTEKDNWQWMPIILKGLFLFLIMTQSLENRMGDWLGMKLQRSR